MKKSLDGETGRNVITVLVADGDRLHKDGLTRLINAEPDMRAAGSESARGRLIATVRRLRPQVTLVGSAAQHTGILDLVGQLVAPPASVGIDGPSDGQRAEGRTKVLMLLDGDDGRVVAEALEAGVRGVVSRTVSAEHLLAGIRSVATGHVFIDARFDPRRLLHRDAADPENGLTCRERKVLELVHRGLSNGEIAERLKLQPKTVEWYCTRLRSKLDCPEVKQRGRGQWAGHLLSLYGLVVN